MVDKDALKLLEMLTYCRPAGSQTEGEFIKRYIKPTGAYRTIGGNYLLVIPGDPDTLFSCHTDTVHSKGGKQEVLYDMDFELAFVDGNDPLGADNTAGVWMLLEMIAAKIPGTYLFHFGEERGCLGSKDLAKQAKDWLSQHKRAIAFDRRGTTSVITRQRSDRCCSDKFGQALADALGDLEYELDPTGLYTDTASYMEIIPECTNVSVGYDHEHGPEETLDIGHCKRLRDQVLTINWGALPTERDPSVEDYDWHARGGGWNGKYSSYSDYISGKDDINDDNYVSKAGSEQADYLDEEAAIAKAQEMNYSRDDLEQVMYSDPDYVLDLLYLLLHKY